MIIYDDIKYVVYWLHDETCTTPELSGYVGITFNLKRRVQQHRSARKLPREFEVTVLFTGTANECVALEVEYRPRPSMGWNTYSGGKVGRKSSLETNEKNRQSQLGKKRTDETKRKIGDVRRGGHREDLTEESRRGIVRNLTGLTASEETRKRQSRSHEERWARKGRAAISDEGWNNIRRAQLGNKHGIGTDLSRMRMRAAHSLYTMKKVLVEMQKVASL